MRKLLAVFPAVVLILLSLSLWGCSDDEDNPVGVSVGPCSFELTEPLVGDRFLPGASDSQTVKIRWDKTGGGNMVNIDLFKGDNKLARLVSRAANNGYYSWRANNHGADDGADFAVRVSADADSNCLAFSESFVMLNTIGCTINFINSFPDSLHVDDVITLTWESNDIPGLVDIELDIRGVDPHLIATGLPTSGSYDWTVETFGLGSADRYSLLIKDSKIPRYCFDESDEIKIEDPE